MKLAQIVGQVSGSGISEKKSMNNSLKEANVSFADTLKQAAQDVNSLQSEATKAIEGLVTGEATDLHEVMIAVEKAKTSFELLMEVRNKTIEAYREIMRMQV